MSPAEFRSMFDGLVRATDEYTKLIPVLEETVLPTLSNSDTLLDVGAGPGLLAVPLSSHFSEISLIEPDSVYCLQAVEKLLAKGKLVTAYNGIWDTAQLANRAYDLIVCSHVLYFVEPTDWHHFINKMLAHQAPGGRLVIILVAREDKSNATIQDYLSIDEVGSFPFSTAAIEYLREQGHRFDLLTFEASISAETPERLLETLALFPVMQYDTASTEAQRLDLIRTHFKVGDIYEMPYAVDVINVRASE